MKYPVILICMLFLTSCDNLLWEPRLLIPLGNINANISDVSDIEDKALSISLLPDSLGYPVGIKLNVPPIGPRSFGPTENVLSDFFLDFTISDAVFNIGVSNSFPIIIGQGTRLVFSSSKDTSAAFEIFSFELQEDVQPGSSICIPTEASEIIIPNTVFMTLENFNSPGQDSIAFLFTPSDFVIDLDLLSIDKVRLLTEKELKITERIDADIEDLVDDDEESDTAKIFVNFFNELPINVTIQIYFLGLPSGTDSLFFTPQFLEAATTDPITGELTSDRVERNLVVELATERLKSWESSQEIVFDMSVNTLGIPDSFVTASSNLGLRMTTSGAFRSQANL